MVIDRAIFLDIDGVLVLASSLLQSRKLWFNHTACPFVKDCVDVLNRIIEITDAEIVLTSSWRLEYDWKVIGEIFAFNGVKKEPIAMTENFGFWIRSKEIEHFLRENKVIQFVILDDTKIFNFDEHFIQINPNKGLTKRRIKRILQILKCD